MVVASVLLLIAFNVESNLKIKYLNESFEIKG